MIDSSERRAEAVAHYGHLTAWDAMGHAGECLGGWPTHQWEHATGNLPRCVVCHKDVYQLVPGIAANIVCSEDGYRIMDMGQPTRPIAKKVHKTLRSVDTWLARRGIVVKIS